MKADKPTAIFRPSQWATLAIVSALAGCSAVGPNYEAPELTPADVPEQWTSHATPANTDEKRDSARVANWWLELSDPVLNELVDAAFASNPTLEGALARLDQSRATARQANAGNVALTGTGAAQRASLDGDAGKSFSDSWLSLNASWEIDLFGAVRRGKEATRARVAARAATLADVRITLAADVSDAYLAYRACQSYAELSEQDVTSREATATLIRASVKEGFTAPYQAIRTQASVAEAKTRLAATRAQCKQLENQLTRLTGIPRPKLMKALADKPTGISRLPVPRQFSIAIPGQALLQRPDIRAAERSLAAASADIGLAEADRYPRLSLNGGMSYTVQGEHQTGTLSFGNWSFGPSITLPIFDAGRRKAAVEFAKSAYTESLADYKTKVRAAIQDVEDALTRYGAAHERAENARLASIQYRSFFESVDVRFREGASNLLELEDARRSMLSAKQTYLRVQQERLQAWVALNRATGGGARYETDSAPAVADNSDRQ